MMKHTANATKQATGQVAKTMGKVLKNKNAVEPDPAKI